VIRQARWPVWLLILGLIGLPLLIQSQDRPATKKQASAEGPQDTLSRAIRHQLNVLPYGSVFDYVAYTLDGTSVTLTGYAVRPTLKVDAEKAVKSIEGVGTVVNRIEVLPVSASDDELRRAIYRGIYEDPVLQKYAVEAMPSIHIIVKNGSVTLEGTVEQESEKHLAETRASGVAGVQEMKNNLQVREKGNAAH